MGPLEITSTMGEGGGMNHGAYGWVLQIMLVIKFK